MSLLVLTFGYTQYHAQGAGVSAVGDIIRTILHNRNPCGDGIIGGLLDAIVGAILADVSCRTSKEPALNDEVVERRTADVRLIKEEIE